MSLQRSFALASLILLLGAGCSKTAELDASVVPSAPKTSNTSSSSSPSTTSMWTFPGTLPADQIENKQIRITTEKGDIVFKLFPDTAPNTVSNFVYLTQGGYYDGLTFHRVEKSPQPFVIQGGDPTGTGSGGPGYKFADELNDSRTYTRGIVAMANSGSNTNGSQFFIMLGDTPLPHLYSIFGEVTEGMDVVDQIKKGDKMTKVVVEDLK